MVKTETPLRPYITPVILVTGCLTGAAALLLHITANPGGIENRILFQLYIICAVFALSSLALYQKSASFHIPVFLVKIFCLYFISKAAGSEILPLICLFFNFCFEVFFFSGIRIALALGTAALGIVAFSSSAHTSWNITRPVITIEKIFILALSSAASSITGAICAQVLNAKDKREKEIIRLEEAVNNLTKTNTAYQTYATYIEETSKEEERHRISREIHDIVGYSMTNLLMIVQAALYSENQDQITELLQKAQTHINDSLLEVRMALRKLRSTQKKTLHGSELIRYLTENFQNVTGINITLDFISFPRNIEVTVEEILYRMIQECMTNSFRHGRASEIFISFWTSADTLIIKIRDNGKAHNEDLITEGIGIQGMRERITGAGGTLSMDSVIDGFTVLAYLPLTQRTPA